MQELEKGMVVAIHGQRRDAILAKFLKQVQAWGMRMPASEPLVLDFGLDNFPEVGLTEVWICNETVAGYCGKYLYLADGQTCPMHRHREKTETFFVVKGSIEVCVNGNVRILSEGDTLLIEPWTPHSMTGIGPAMILELSTPCHIDDNYFEDPRIPIGGNFGGGVL